MMVIVTMPTVLAPTWLHVIDSLQLNFIHVSPSMPTIISLMLGLGLTPHEGAKEQESGRMLLTH